MICNICHLEFSGEKGLNIHKKRAHNLEPPSMYCKYCNKMVTRKAILERHELICSMKPSNQVKESTEEKQVAQQNITNVQNTYQNIQQNIQINAENIMVYYPPNTTNKPNIKDIKSKLVPVTNETLKTAVESIFKKNGNLHNTNQFTSMLVNETLKYAVVCSDDSRGTCLWIDGDLNNREIKDPKCIHLGGKTVRATKDIANLYNKRQIEYSNLIIKEYQEAKKAYDENNDDATYKIVQEKLHTLENYTNSSGDCTAKLANANEGIYIEIGEQTASKVCNVSSFKTYEEEVNLLSTTDFPLLTQEDSFLVKKLKNLITNEHGGLFYLSPYEIGRNIIRCIGPLLDVDQNHETSRRTYYFKDHTKQRQVITYEILANSWHQAFRFLSNSYNFSKIMTKIQTQAKKEITDNYLDNQAFIMRDFDTQSEYAEKLYLGFLELPEEF
jgi:hypothetical protein